MLRDAEKRLKCPAPALYRHSGHKIYGLKLAKKKVFFFDKKWHLAEEGSLVWGYAKDMGKFFLKPTHDGYSCENSF